MLAVVCDDLVVRIIDIETRRIVREMGGFLGSVLDVVRAINDLPMIGLLRKHFRHSHRTHGGWSRHL